MKYVDIRDMPPCAFSPQCLRLLDDLDMPPAISAPTRFAYIEDLQDERQLRQLRSHVSTCPTCSTLLAKARRVRTEQRAMLYHFLLTSERDVPSTTSAIFAAIREEKAQYEEEDARPVRARSQNLTLCAPPDEQDNLPFPAPVPSHSRPFHLRHLFQNILTLATVAAVILAAVGLFNRFTNKSNSNQSTSNSSQPPTQDNSTINTYGWDTVVIGLTVLSAAGMVKSLTFYSYNAPSGKMSQLVSVTQDFAAVETDGISQDGQSMLYATTSPAQQKTYATYPSSTAEHSFYQLDANEGGNAIWMDAEHVLVQDTAGKVVELNVRSGDQRTWALKTGKLAFYHQPFLYFAGAEQADAGQLYRVNLADAELMPQLVAQAAPDTRFWLNPAGTTIFYANQEASGEQGIYAVGSDGTNAHLWRAEAGVPIGYAANSALMTLQQVGEKLEVVQLGATPTQPEHVVLADAAPGAVSLCGPDGETTIIALCAQNIALEPDGHGLLLHVYYANGEHSLVYDDLATGTSRTLRSLPTNAGVQLPGWSKISTPATSLNSQTACLCA